jgi:aryl-alcohol dehydrogenase-like predicted oxidoreductase
MKEKVQLGNSDLKVSRIMLGCWSFGGEEGSYWGEQKQTDVNSLVAEALDRGINFFDTAVAYNNGKSEISLGQALKGRRKDAVICNKFLIIEKDQLKNYENLLRESLARLDTDYIDLMMIHWPAADADLLKANLEALLKARQQGIIREIGVSNFGLGALKTARECGVNVIANEFGYNLISRGMEKEVLPCCRENNISVLAYSPLMQGVLTGKYRKLSDIPPSRRRTVHFSKMENPDSNHGGPGADTEVEALLIGLKSLSEKTGISSGTLSIAWLCHQEGVSCVIAGCRSVEQLRENMMSVETKLSFETIKELTNLSQPIFEKIGHYLDVYRGSVNPRIW